MTGPVVVGLDGSPASVTAAWWAAREAVDRRLPLLLLHSWTTQPLNVPIAQAAHSKRRYGEQVLRRTEAELLHRYDTLAVTAELVSAPASQALVDLSESAELLVLGSRGYGSVSSFLLGSISLHVLGLSHCPAVTVRAGDPAVETGFGRPAVTGRDEVVVGVQDVAPAVDPLLEFAFATADVHGVALRAVRALALSTLAGDPGTDGQLERERERLAAVLAPWQDKFPGVDVVQQTAHGSASQVLLTASAHARLALVGRRRHPSPLMWKLGPVAHAALHHLPCPVAVVPHD
ncbi:MULTISPECIES: universal stress protein [unclassified Streptomyces]|uniref:universal stress protein n=1 Tax=unclassified Streptomyces TaxID=2593676 RepID=UPI003D733836